MMAHLDFDALRNMHDSANDDLLHSPLIFQQSLRRHGGQRIKCLHRVSDASLRMLDVCHVSNDLLSVAKDHVLELRLALRRSTGAQEAEADYNRFRKKLEKETVKWMKRITAVSILEVKDHDNDDDHQVLLVPVVDVLREVRATIISIVQSLLSLITVPWLERSSSSSSRSSCIEARYRGLKLMMLRSSGHYTNCHRFYYLDDDDEAIYSAQKRLEAVEITIQHHDAEITSICRRLIHTRFLLLNILTNL